MRSQNLQIDQIAQLAVLALIVDAGYAMDRAFSPKVKANPPVKSEEQVTLLDKFLKLNPEAQRGAIQYIEQMREGYKKTRKEK